MLPIKLGWPWVGFPDWAAKSYWTPLRWKIQPHPAAVAEWLHTCCDAGIEISAIRRMSALTERRIKQRLKRAWDASSGNPPAGLITPAPDETPGRVS